VTLADEMFAQKKLVPGPPHYDNTGLKDKVHGFYGPTEVKCSVVGSTAYEKKFVPGPNLYESRGKSMSEILKEKAKNYLYVYKADPSKKKVTIRVKKTNDPAPTSYNFMEAREKTSIMPCSSKLTIPKEKSNFISK